MSDWSEHWRYFLRQGDGPWREVEPDEWVRTERAAGFHPKGGDRGQPATGGFSGHGHHGRMISKTSEPPAYDWDPEFQRVAFPEIAHNDDTSILRVEMLAYLNEAAKGTMHDSYVPFTAWDGLITLVQGLFGTLTAEMSMNHVERMSDMRAALRDAVDTIKGLADQQAMPDDWYVPILERLEKML